MCIAGRVVGHYAPSVEKILEKSQVKRQKWQRQSRMSGGDSRLNCMQEGLIEADLGYFAPGRQNAPITIGAR